MRWQTERESVCLCVCVTQSVCVRPLSEESGIFGVLSCKIIFVIDFKNRILVLRSAHLTLKIGIDI